ncbi:4970_t:CDS:2, partial [Racocetra persica]
VATTMIYADDTKTSDCASCVSADTLITTCTQSTTDNIKNVQKDLLLKCTCQQKFIDGYASCFKCPAAVEKLANSPSVD